MKHALHFFVFACLTAAVCLNVGCQERSRGGGHNLLSGDAPRLERDGYLYLRKISEGFEPSVEKTTNHLVSFGVFFVLVAALFAAFFGWQAWKRKQNENEQNDPNGLLKELVRAHQLSEQEKHLIQRLSEKNTLSSPLELFVEPKFLLDALKSNLFVSARPSVRRLLSKLFDIDASEQSAAGEETVLITKSSLP